MERELELILRDILDDLKWLKETGINNNNVDIVTERLNAFEKILKDEKQRSSTINTRTIEEAIFKSISELKSFISENNFKKEIVYKHHLHKGLLISVILSCLFLFTSVGWYKSYDVFQQFQANDLKFRFLKMFGDKSLIKLLSYTDSLYKVDKIYFASEVNRAEKIKKTNQVYKNR